VGFRFDDWIYWTFLLQLPLITTSHTLNSFLITNLSLLPGSLRVSSLSNSLLCATHGFSATSGCKRPPLSPINLQHRPHRKPLLLWTCLQFCSLAQGMAIICCVLLHALPSNGLFTKNLSLQDHIYRAVA
jgi:hypothetical protein